MKERTEYQTDFTALAHHLNIRLRNALGPQTWLGETKTGMEVVIKCGSGAREEVYDFLIKCNSLYPSFQYPRIISADPGFYLLYQYIPGSPLEKLDFESEGNLTAAFELSGRVTALCRSLKLAPMFQRLQSKTITGENPQEISNQHLSRLGSGFDYRMDDLAVRRADAARSYDWAQHIVDYCASKWPESDFRVPWEGLRQRVETVTSIHLAVQGSHVAHTCFTPEHILLTGKDHWGLVGWQVAPRPYNYMRYRYLSWCLIHSSQGDIEKRYRNFLQTMPTIYTAAANSLTFALSLLECWIDTRKEIKHRAEKLQAVSRFIDEALSVEEEDKAD